MKNGTALKKIIGIRFLVGLPGAGKSTFAYNYCKTHNECRIINFDETYIDSVINNGVFNLVEVFEKNLKYKEGYSKYYDHYDSFDLYMRTNNNKDLFILDGLFLNDRIIINTYFSFCKFLKNSIFNKDNTIIKFAIDYWKPDKDKCIANDKYRVEFYRDRTKDSKSLINNYDLKKPDIDLIYKTIQDAASSNDYILPIEGKIDIFEQETITASIFDKAFKPYAIEEDDGKKYLYSQEWSGGGTWADYTGSSGPIEADPPVEFEEFDNILRNVAPKINFLEYKDLKKTCVELYEYEDYGYYGGHETLYKWKCDLDLMYEELKKLGYISEENNTK